MTDFTPEMIEKAKAAKSAEELLAIAKENGIELTEEEAKNYFEQLCPKSGELSDDELDNVAGGGCPKKKEPEYELDYGKRKCDACGCNRFYKRGEDVDRLRPYWICRDCGKVCYDPYRHFEHN